jgi:hypothetical protein
MSSRARIGWAIWYADGSVGTGRTQEEWRAAPADGVQAVARFPRREPVRWSCSGGAVMDRDLWTGEDVYDPFGWGEKRGSLMRWADYEEIWERACGGD